MRWLTVAFGIQVVKGANVSNPQHVRNTWLLQTAASVTCTKQSSLSLFYKHYLQNTNEYHVCLSTVSYVLHS